MYFRIIRKYKKDKEREMKLYKKDKKKREEIIVQGNRF